MLPDSPSEIFRTFNLILGIIVFLWLVARRLRHRDWYPRGGLRRDIWSMAFCWDLALLVATVEQLFETGTSIRIGVSMAALLTTVAILIRPKEEWPSPDWKDKQSR